MKRHLTDIDDALARLFAGSFYDHGCWTRRGVGGGGYSHIVVGGKDVRAHRFSYEQLVGPIPDGFVIDHICRNRACINPLHLEPTTIRENVERGSHRHLGVKQRTKTHCKNGHPYDEINTIHYTYAARGRTGPGRDCRECSRTRALASYHRRRGNLSGVSV